MSKIVILGIVHIVSIREETMAYYRAYQLSHDDHIAHPAEIIEADNDDAAIEKANELVNGHDVEVWRGSRFVIKLQSKDACRGQR